MRRGHPWLFADSVLRQDRRGCAGELAVIYDRKNRFLAAGLFDPDSPIRVRVLQAGKPQTIDLYWWSERLQQARERRQNLFDEQTTGYRWINGESDGWPGLVLDRYDTTLVLKLYTAAWLPRLEEIIGLMVQQLHQERIVLRLSRNLRDVAQDQFAKKDGEILFGPTLGEPVIFSETGLRFESEVLRGQKTGFFLDQRENRRNIEGLARGRSVLNAFSFSGGFSLYAARGGALVATDLDLSAHALRSASRNFALNHEVLQADAFEWLSANPKRKFDLAVLDPPSFATREAERAGALRAYAKLAALAIEHLSSGGILVACSCSAHVAAQEFFEAARMSAAKSKRRFVELRTTCQPRNPKDVSSNSAPQAMPPITLRHSERRNTSRPST